MPNPFSIIPQKVLRNKDLKDNELRLLCVLSTYVNADLLCYPSYTTLAESCGCSRLTVIRILAKLCRLGYVSKMPTKRQDGGYGSNVYYINYNPTPPSITTDTSPSITTDTSPSITTDTSPSITTDTSLVSPLIPAKELNPYELNINPKGFEKSARKRARIREENKLKAEQRRLDQTLTDDDKAVFSALEEALVCEIGDNTQKALNLVSIKKIAFKRYAFVAGSDFIARRLEEIGFWKALNAVMYVFRDAKVRIIKNGNCQGVDIKQLFEKEKVA